MNNRQLQNLISRWLDEAIESEEFLTLQATLKESASARRIYRTTMCDNAGLYRLARAGREHIQELAAEEGCGETSRRSIPIAPRTLAFFAFAAGLLLALGVWQSVGQRKQEPALAKVAGEQSVPAGESSILTKIEPVSGACRWHVENARRSQAESFQSGDIIRVTSGKLKLHYANGSTIVLHSPSAYQLFSEKDSLMLAGRITASISEAGIGFSVITPRATVIDLGTDFGIEVNSDGATDVVVFKGEVDVDYHDDQVSVQRLRMGQAVHLDATGTASRILSITDSTYSSESLQESLRTLIITEVRDNIDERGSSLNYYEIVHAGMDEDVYAYVDREHQYNGITKAGMPPYLVGGDYVKTFNDDKVNRNIRIRIKLAVPAKLYILIDDRLTPPQWLRDRFRDTGDNVGIELWGPVFVNGRWRRVISPTLGVGPGVASGQVDTLSVWVRDVPDPGVVALGSTENSNKDTSMYGIVAVPLDESN